ncbi:hypothetical protein ACIHFC_37920, partial [Streptomyces sp. NPDC052013]|uniref:hypothetical protein n=1 Tax=Streptomyces sp. NPDC052013 TaxID=3365679 RepID=UPI0037D0CF68
IDRTLQSDRVVRVLGWQFHLVTQFGEIEPSRGHVIDGRWQFLSEWCDADLRRFGRGRRSRNQP